MLHISPDGSQLAYINVENTTPPRARLVIRTLATGAERDVPCALYIEQFFWHADGKHLLVKSPITPRLQKFHAWLLDIETGFARDLTPFKGIGFESWDYSEQVPDELLVTMRMGKAVADVFRIHLSTGSVELDTPNPGDSGDIFGVDWLADHLLRVRGNVGILPNGGFLVRYREPKKSQWRELLKLSPDEEPPFFQQMSADSEKVRMVLSIGADTARIVEIDPRTEKRRIVASNDNFDLFTTYYKRGTPQGYKVYGEHGEWHALVPEFQQDLDKLKTVEPGDLDIVSDDFNGDNWIVHFSTSANPGSYYFYDRHSGTAKYLFDQRPSISRTGTVLSEKKPVHITTRDSMDLLSYLSLPHGVPPEKLPVVLVIHGGPEARDVEDYEEVVQWLTSRGYAVLQPNYRGSSGFGKKFWHLQNREWAGKMLDDLIDCRDWLVREGIGDPDRMGILGTSYGGYAVLCALAFRPNVFRCGVDIAGISSLITDYQTLPEPDRFYLPVIERARGSRVGEEAFLKSRSPLYAADKIKAPLIIWHGNQDVRVPVTESLQMVMALRAQDKPVSAFFEPTAAHQLPGLDTRFWDNVETTFAHVLGGRVVDKTPIPATTYSE